MPSTFTSRITSRPVGVMAYFWLPPHANTVEPLGEIVPPGPAVDEILNGPYVPNVASMVWLALMPVNVYVETAPTETPSTWTSAMKWHLSDGVIEYFWSAPQL